MILMSIVIVTFLAFVVFLSDKISNILIAWCGILLFGSGIFLGVYRLFHPSVLKITVEGIEIDAIKPLRLKWNDVESFEVYKSNHNKLVNIKYAESYQGELAGRTIAKSMTGSEGAIETYGGKSAEELTDLLNSYAQHYRSLIHTTP